MQEVANARRATVSVGRNTVSSRMFAIAPQMMGIKPCDHCQAVLDGMPGHLRVSSWWNSERDLFTLLKKFRLCEASDPRDKIYALLGITQITSNENLGLGDLMIQPDYSKSIQAVIQDVVMEMLGLGLPSHHHTIDGFLANLDHELRRMTVIMFKTGTLEQVFRHSSLSKLWRPNEYTELLHAATLNKQYGVQIVNMILEQHETFPTGGWLRRVLMNLKFAAEDVAFLCEAAEDKRILDELFRFGDGPMLELRTLPYAEELHDLGCQKAFATIKMLQRSTHAWIPKYLEEFWGTIH